MSHKKHVRLFFVLAGLFFTLNSSLSKTMPGYIVTNNSDTIFGEIKTSRFDLLNNGFIIRGINLEHEKWKTEKGNRPS